MIRILVTGSRNWSDADAIRDELANWLHFRFGEDPPPPVTLVHGGARGADRLAGQIAREYGWTVEVHPADWERYGRSAGHRRNAEMVAAGADVVLAFPLGASRGTRGCVAAAAKAGIPVLVCEPKRAAS